MKENFKRDEKGRNDWQSQQKKPAAPLPQTQDPSQSKKYPEKKHGGCGSC